MTLCRFTSAIALKAGPHIWVNPHYVVQIFERPDPGHGAVQPHSTLRPCTIIRLQTLDGSNEVYVTESADKVARQLGWRPL